MSNRAKPPRKGTEASEKPLSKKAKQKQNAKEVANRVKKVKDKESESEEEDEEDEGVNEESMAKLLEALGDDGLDDIGQMQLEALEEEDDSEEEDGDLSEDDEIAVEGEEPEDADESAEGREDDDEDDEKDSETQENIVEEENDEVLSSKDDVVALDDVESVDEDAVPRQKIVINDTEALNRILDTVKLDSKLPWTETLVVTYPGTLDVDVTDDLNRELAFYKQALHGAKEARKLADKHNFPFTRPADYYAEMVKSDAHMERIRQRLLDENAAMKKSETKRKEREGKKFGKQVQLEKQKERERSKKDMEERLKGLKRKRGDALDQANDDAFDVAVEDAIAERPAKKSKGSNPRMSRKGRDAKFGFGGKVKRSKQNTRESTESFAFGNKKGPGGKGGKGGVKPKRLGKSRRMAGRSR